MDKKQEIALLEEVLKENLTLDVDSRRHLQQRLLALSDTEYKSETHE